MTTPEDSNDPVRVKITQQAKKDVCEFTIKVAQDTTDEQMQEREKIAWESVDRMIAERTKRGFITDA